MLKYESEIRALLCQVFGLDQIEDISNKDDLKAVGLDSLNCLEVIIAIEDEYHITIPEEKLGLQYVHNIYDICKLTEEVINSEQLQTV